MIVLSTIRDRGGEELYTWKGSNLLCMQAPPFIINCGGEKLCQGMMIHDRITRRLPRTEVATFLGGYENEAKDYTLLPIVTVYCYRLLFSNRVASVL